MKSKSFPVKNLTVLMPRDHDFIRSWEVGHKNDAGVEVKSIVIHPNNKAVISSSKDEKFSYTEVNFSSIVLWVYDLFD